MKTMVLSKHEPTIEYIKHELKLEETNTVVRHNLNPTEINNLKDENIDRIVGNAPLWLIREFNRHGIDYHDFSFRRIPPEGEELTREEFDAYKPKIEAYTVKQGNLEDFESMVNKVRENPPTDKESLYDYL